MRRFALLTLLPLTLAACASSPERDPARSDPVDTSVFNTYHWQLTEATDSQGRLIGPLFVRSNKPVQLEFQGDRFSVVNTCNQMGGRYTVQGNRINFFSMASTMKMCADANLAKLDEEVGRRLEKATTFMLQNVGQPLQTAGAPRLTVSTESGDKLIFTGKLTAEARYGGPGEIVFLEVAPQAQPCHHPLMPNARCLQVRQIYYDANGRKITTTNRWEPLYQQVEGYQHEEGVRNVVRVKRFKVQNPPADAPDTVYIMDTVIESEVMPRQ